jgi:hypothetical protein
VAESIAAGLARDAAGRTAFRSTPKIQVFNCRGFEGGDVIALVQHIDGSDFMEAVATLAGAAERTDCRISKQPALSVKKCESKPPKEIQSYAFALWRASADPRGTLVEQYLKSRALELPDEAANEAIRFHPDCPFMAERFPAMICLVRNIVTNEPQAIHRTALAAGGTAIKRNKTFRLSLDPVSGGAIKIDPDEDVTRWPLHRRRRRDVSKRPANGIAAGLVRREHGRRCKLPGRARRRKSSHFR